MAPIRLGIVDDHTLFRRALGQLLALQPDIDVVGEAGDAREAVEFVRTRAPDVVLVDVDFPGPGAVPTVRRMRQVAPDAHILMLSMYDNPVTIQALLALGVRGYLLKSTSEDQLLAAIREVTVNPRQVVLWVTSRLFDAAPAGGSPQFSDREVEILTLTSAALSNAQIANRLHLKEATVKRYLHTIFGKLGAVSRIDAVNKAQKVGLLTVPVSD